MNADRRRCWGRLVGALVACVLATPADSAAGPGESQGIAYVHDGHIGLLRPGQREAKCLLAPTACSGLASAGGALGCVGDDRRLFVLKPADWTPRQVSGEAQAATGRPCWFRGARYLMAALGPRDRDADGGLWLIDCQTRSRRIVAKPADVDLPVNDQLAASPSATLVASAGVITMHLFMRVLSTDGKWAVVRDSPNGILGARDFAWLDDRRLLVGGAPDKDTAGAGQGGLRLLDTTTGRWRRWAYSAQTEVVQVVASADRKTLAVGLGQVDTPSSLPAMAISIELIGARTRQRKPLRLPRPAAVCGFSGDGARLLVLMLQEGKYAEKADLFSVTTQTGRAYRVAQDATDAVWIVR